MPASWPKEPTVIGTMVKRVDGAQKTSGLAKYTYDINRPGLLHAIFVSSPYAHAVIEAVDISAAENMPGVKGIHFVRKTLNATVGAELTWAGEPILAIAAETENQAYDAARAVKIQYKTLPHAVKIEVSAAPDAAKVTLKGDNVIKGRAATKGNLQQALADATAVVEGTYGMPAISHCCLESHGAVAEWNENKLTVWSSTQAVQGVAQSLAKEFNISVADVLCITHFMGGGFGSKFSPGAEGFAAAHLAKITKRPVKLMLDRKEEHNAGIRPAEYATVKAGADKSGKLIAFYSRAQGCPGVGSAAKPPLPYVYENIPVFDNDGDTIRINQHESRAYRAPNHPQGCFIMEAVMDDLAAKLPMDPVEFRRRNLPEGLIGEIYRRELDIGTKLIGWKEKYHPPGKGGKGPVKRGLGMGCHKWGGSGVANEQMLVEITSDGNVLVQSSTQDLGTANRTVLNIVAAEVFGLKPDQITSKIGESPWARSHGSGGSTTCPSTAPATLVAATEARDQLFAKLAPVFECKPEELSAKAGKITGKSGKSMTWSEAVRKLGMDKISVVGTYRQMNLSSVGVGGCQFAEVEVDEETGVVRVLEVVAVQDCGLIINKLACESQTAGGVIMGVNAALYEEWVLDQVSGRMLNPDMEFYKLGTITDMPKITVHMFDDPISQSRGVIGIGEPPTISTAAAIGNAIFNALGVRVPIAPFSPRNVLAAIAKANKGANT